jgi:hypothetical protein
MGDKKKKDTPKQTKQNKAQKANVTRANAKQTPSSRTATPNTLHTQQQAAATPRGEMTGNWRSGTLAANR